MRGAGSIKLAASVICTVPRQGVQLKRYAGVGNRVDFSSSSVARRYLERLYDHDAKGFLEILRHTTFERNEDIRAMFNGFQRYLPHLRGGEMVELIEMLHLRDMRENDEGSDLFLLLICEMNKRLLSGQNRYFSLKQIHRICSVLKHVKFNRPSYLIATPYHAVASAANGTDTQFDAGFLVTSALNPDVDSHVIVRNADVSHVDATNRVKRTSSHPNGGADVAIEYMPAAIEGTSTTTTTCEVVESRSSDMNPTVMSARNADNEGGGTTAGWSSLPGVDCQGRLHNMFRENYREVLVPVCECNMGAVSSYYACQKCNDRYGHLLDIAGHDHLALLIVLLGRSIVIQSQDIRKRHENAVANYFIASAHLSFTLNSHILSTIMTQYRTAFTTSKSLRNIAIAIQTAKKCKVRSNGLARALIARLAEIGNFERLCANERNLATLLIAFNQIVSGIITTNRLPIVQQVKRLGINIVTYLVDNYDRIFCSNIDHDTLSSAKGSTRLLVDYLTEKGVDFNKILLDCDMEKLQAILADGKVEYFKDFKTSDLHKQVASALEMLGVETEEEVYINPHFCDLLLKRERVVVEIDGPYHFNTSLNHRTNKLLKRNTNGYMISYTHNSRIKRFILGIKGYRVVHIPYFRWPANRQEQLVYARQVIS